MKKPLIVVSLLAVLLGASVTNSPASASAAPAKPKLPTVTKYVPVFHVPTRPCADDFDDRNCYWDAAKRGNGKGYSYYVDRTGNVTYLNPKLNDKVKRQAWKRTNQAAKREYWGTVWGHRLCYAKVGNTSYIYCFDGYRETS
ncbi:hypothetical protein ACGFYA_20720 [Streptomyces sp. NPDC048305]|uniref:hypothetical protein n=1 Tax=Streptomyces sp. NPDC048305 TaxID=3365532 RepID=UPI0037137E26